MNIWPTCRASQLTTRFSRELGRFRDMIEEAELGSTVWRVVVVCEHGGHAACLYLCHPMTLVEFSDCHEKRCHEGPST